MKDIKGLLTEAESVLRESDGKRPQFKVGDKVQFAGGSVANAVGTVQKVTHDAYGDVDYEVLIDSDGGYEHNKQWIGKIRTGSQRFEQNKLIPLAESVLRESEIYRLNSFTKVKEWIPYYKSKFTISKERRKAHWDSGDSVFQEKNIKDIAQELFGKSWEDLNKEQKDAIDGKLGYNRHGYNGTFSLFGDKDMYPYTPPDYIIKAAQDVYNKEWYDLTSTEQDIIYKKLGLAVKTNKVV